MAVLSLIIVIVNADFDVAFPSTLTKTTFLRFLFMPPISARQRRTCWHMISLALSTSKIQPESDTSGGLEDPDSQIDPLLMHGTLP